MGLFTIIPNTNTEKLVLDFADKVSSGLELIQDHSGDYNVMLKRKTWGGQEGSLDQVYADIQFSIIDKDGEDKGIHVQVESMQAKENNDIRKKDVLEKLKNSNDKEISELIPEIETLFGFNDEPF